MKIKIKTTEKVEKEIEKEIELPYYTKDMAWHYKIVSEKASLACAVSTDGSSAWINKVEEESRFNEAVSKNQSTEQEFNEVFNKAKEIINGN